MGVRLMIYKSQVCICDKYRKESCKKAYTEAQGMMLFGNKLILATIDRDGMHSMYKCTDVIACMIVRVNIIIYMYVL